MSSSHADEVMQALSGMERWLSKNDTALWMDAHEDPDFERHVEELEVVVAGHRRPIGPDHRECAQRLIHQIERNLTNVTGPLTMTIARRGQKALKRIVEGWPGEAALSEASDNA